jgi:hypothetical protein
LPPPLLLLLPAASPPAGVLPDELQPTINAAPTDARKNTLVLFIEHYLPNQG